MLVVAEPAPRVSPYLVLELVREAPRRFLNTNNENHIFELRMYERHE